jgi:hypothetical protein
MSVIEIPITITTDDDTSSYRVDVHGSTVAIADTPQLALYKAGAVLGSLDVKELQDLKEYYSKTPEFPRVKP